MKKIYTLLGFIPTFLTASSAVIFSGVEHGPVVVTPPSSSGINEVSVLPSVSGAKMIYIADSDNPVKVMRFGKSGASLAEEISGVAHSGREWSLDNVEGDCGYIFEEGNSSFFVWVIDYSDYALMLQSLRISPESDCNTVVLDFEGNAGAIPYYSINGRLMHLDRELELSYRNLVYDEDSHLFNEENVVTQFEEIGSTVRFASPLCDTEFALVGDRFLKSWNQGDEIISDLYVTKSVDLHAWATQTAHDADNEISSDNASLGGSAPAEILFEAAVTDATVFNEWQMSRSADFDVIEIRQNGLSFPYTFTSDGTFYVRFVGADVSGDCEKYSSLFEINIGASEIKCPNAFSPGGSEGVNDVWKVAYKSIIRFDCHIFNRWGVEVASFRDPSDGWDGTYKGKLVPAGVYYYVIDAEGADGRHYRLKGDINIIKQRQSNYNTTIQ